MLNGKGEKASKKKRKEEIGKADPSRQNSPNRAFVVQFRDPAELGPAHFAGRAEHVMSGQSTSFEKPEELIEFFGRVMKQLKP